MLALKTPKFISQIKLLLAYAAFAICISSCSSSLKMGALEEINQEAINSTHKPFSDDFDQQRLLSISGMLPMNKVGELHNYSGSKTPASQSVGISSKSDQSYVHTTVFEYGGTYEEFRNIKIKIHEMQLLVGKYVEAKISEIQKLDTLVGLKKQQAKLKTASTALNAQVASAQNDHDKAVLASAKASTEIDKAELDIARAISQKNIIVYRWGEEEKGIWAGVLGSLFSGRNEFARRKQGYGLIAGLRISTMQVGSDIHKAWKWLDDEKRDGKTGKKKGKDYRHKKRMITQVWEAQYIQSMSLFEEERLLKMKIKASYETLANLPRAVSELQEIELESMLQRARTLSNVSSIAKSSSDRKEINLSGDALSEVLSKGSDKWKSFYVVMTNLKDLTDLVPKNNG